MFSGFLNITKLYAQAVPWLGQKRNTLNDTVLHTDWPISDGVRKLNDTKNRVTFAGGFMALNPL
jgi:hypothetical protein